MSTAVIFDMDGTLFDTEAVFQKYWNAIAKERGIVLPDAFKYEICGTSGEVMNRDRILQQLRGIGFDGLDRSIDARISRLRRKLGDDPENPTRIKTVRGKGYLFSKHDW